MRWVIARVLPVPAPASTHTGPCRAVATSRCSGSSPSSTASAESGTCGKRVECVAAVTWPCCQVAGDGCGGCPQGGPRSRTNAAGVTSGRIPPVGMGARSRALPPWTTFPELPEERERDAGHCDDVQHHVVRLLPPAEEPDGPRGHC